VTGFAFSADGRFVAAVTRSGWEGGRPGLGFYETATGQPVGEFVDMPDAPSLFRDRDGVTVWSYRPQNGTLRSWDLRTGRAVNGGRDLHPGQNAGVVAFRPDGNILAAPLPGGLLQWDMQSGRRIGPPMATPADGEVRLLSYSPVGDLLAVGYSGGVARLFDTATAKAIGPSLTHRSRLTALAFTADGNGLVAAQADGTVETWAVPQEVPDEPERLEAWIGLVSGRPKRAEANPLSPDEWGRAKAALGGWSPVPGDGPAAYELAALRDAERIGSNRALLWHLNRLIAAHPDDCTYYARRAEVRAAAHDWEAARADLDRASHCRDAAALTDRLRQAARNARRRSDATAAAWLLTRVIASDAGDWCAYADRAWANDKLGRVDDMERDLFAARERGVEEREILTGADQLAGRERWAAAAKLLAGRPSLRAAYCRAVALTKAGDRSGYRALCEDITRAAAAKLSAEITRATGAKVPADDMALLAWCFTLDAHATGDWSTPLHWIEAALQSLKTSRANAPPGQEARLLQILHAWQNTRGVLLYRAGRFREAVETLSAAAAGHPAGGTPEDWIFLGLAHAKLGEAEESRKWLAKAAAGGGSDNVWSRAELDLFRREAGLVE
jgi:hypothetical protein